MRQKQVFSTLVSVYIGSPRLGHTTKKPIKISDLVQGYGQFGFFREGSRTSF